jgi:hypothetical protein
MAREITTAINHLSWKQSKNSVMKSVKVRSLVGHQNSEDNPTIPIEKIKSIPFRCSVSTQPSVSGAVIARGLVSSDRANGRKKDDRQ